MSIRSILNKINRQELQKIVLESTSVSEVLRTLGVNSRGGSPHTLLSNYLKENNFDTSTLVGRAIGRNNSRNKSPQHLLFSLIKNGGNNSAKLKERLFAYGVKEKKCEKCGITHWEGIELKLELHHINGDHNDNRLENLIILCPNCHSLTSNYRGKNTRYQEEKQKLDNLLKEIAENDAKIKLPRLIQESIELKNKPRPPRQRSHQPRSQKPQKPFNKCIVCGKDTHNKTYCSMECQNKHKAKHKPTKEVLLELSKQVHSVSELRRKIDETLVDNTIIKWCKGYGIYDEVKANFKQRTYRIVQYDLEGNFIKEWADGDTINKELGYNKSKIQGCCSGRQQTSYGFKWLYKK